ncbi:MAG TPA: FkbM family methyltransferase [Verrucomicrobiae bacterium]|nr:FkbM family methyltransferase [Verrucomicrobiae bacterium]
MTETLVIAGARGFLAEHTFRGLKTLGITPVSVVDNDPRLWGDSAGNIKIVQPSEAVRDYPDAVYVTAVYNHTPLRRQLRELGAVRVITYAALFRQYPSVFLPYFALDLPSRLAENAIQINAAAEIWADAESRELYLALMQWFKTLDSDAVPRPDSPAKMYFPGFLRLRPDEVFADCGAFDGDTLRQYLRATKGQFSHVTCLEADPSNFELLRNWARTLPQKDRITLVHGAVTHDGKNVQFSASGDVAAHKVTDNGEAGQVITVPGVRLDDLTPSPTFVKMDIEGSEMGAIQGGERLLRSGQTAWAMTLYHHLEDFWVIPLHFRSAAPQLKLFLRHYAEDYAETICYALPPDRVAKEP